VDGATFFAYTGWGADGGVQQPERFAAKTSTATKLPSYKSSTLLNGFRYCMPAKDEVGDEAERVSYRSKWPSEPTASGPGYCLFHSTSTAFSLTRTSSSLSGAAGATVTAAVQASAELQAMIAVNPGVRCEFWGRNTSNAWARLKGGKCSSSGALTHAFALSGSNASLNRVQFFVHSPDYLATTWTLTVR